MLTSHSLQMNSPAVRICLHMPYICYPVPAALLLHPSWRSCLWSMTYAQYTKPKDFFLSGYCIAFRLYLAIATKLLGNLWLEACCLIADTGCTAYYSCCGSLLQVYVPGTVQPRGWSEVHTGHSEQLESGSCLQVCQRSPFACYNCAWCCSDFCCLEKNYVVMSACPQVKWHVMAPLTFGGGTLGQHFAVKDN